jgi:16S rRNA (adenine1518-N6/adenine1519-N6)-dimethyltransferase
MDSQAVLMELKDGAASRIRPACFYPLLRRLFSSRRKTIKNNLTGFITTAMAAEALEKSALDGNKRAEDLALEDFQALAQTIDDMGIL